MPKKKKVLKDLMPAEELKEGVLYHLETGLVYCAVCAPADWDAEKVKAETNSINRPSTMANEWVIKISTETDPNGITCGQDPTRKHWLLVC